MAGEFPKSVYVIAVARRQYIVWRKLIWSAMVSNVANPIIFLFAFGFGLGRFIDSMQGVAYLDFVVPGMIAYSAMFAASFETTIGSFSRYFMLHNWDAVLATPVSLRELLMGEVLWASAKAMISALSVLIVGWLWGGIPSLGGVLAALPIVFVASICFACVGLAATAYAKGYDFFSYFFTFWVTPMFVFCGVFFEISRFPEVIQGLAWFLPMTHLIAVIRPLAIGLPVDPVVAALNIAYMVAMAVVAFMLAHRKMHRRLYD
jgi:lipooligosaccharide transport system permease protein